MPTRRRVTRSEGFVERALALYPLGGLADGTPSFELFESGPLRGVEELFARAFDDQPEAVEGTGIRFAMTHGVPVFPAMVFYGCLGSDGGIELLDVIVHPAPEFAAAGAIHDTGGRWRSSSWRGAPIRS